MGQKIMFFFLATDEVGTTEPRDDFNL